MAASPSRPSDVSTSKRGRRAAFSFSGPHQPSRRKSVHRAGLLLAAFLLLGCQRDTTPRQLEDDLGRRIAAPPQIERVVTLAPNVTEIVFAVGAGAKVVGTDDSSNFPDAVRSVPTVGGLQPDVEKIAALRPDLVIASTEGNHPALATALGTAGIPLYVVRTDRLDQISRAMERVGRLLAAQRTEEAVRELERSIERERRSRRRAPRVLFIVWDDPLYVAGRETFTDDLLTLTGADNAVTVRGWVQYSLEALAAAPPELILFPEGAVSSAQIRTLLRRIPGLDPRIVAVDEDVFQRPGPRMGEAARALNAILDSLER